MKTVEKVWKRSWIVEGSDEHYYMTRCVARQSRLQNDASLGAGLRPAAVVVEIVAAS